jgi:hypothetical protein
MNFSCRSLENSKGKSMKALLTPLNILGVVGLAVIVAFLVLAGLDSASGNPFFWVLGIALLLVGIANYLGRESWVRRIVWQVGLGVVLFLIGHFGGLTFAVLAGLFLAVYGAGLGVERLVEKGGAVALA